MLGRLRRGLKRSPEGLALPSVVGGCARPKDVRLLPVASFAAGGHAAVMESWWTSRRADMAWSRSVAS